MKDTKKRVKESCYDKGQIVPKKRMKESCYDKGQIVLIQIVLKATDRKKRARERKLFYQRTICPEGERQKEEGEERSCIKTGPKY